MSGKVIRMSGRASASAADDLPRASTVGMSVTVLHGKAREYAMREFFVEKVPSVRGEKVVQQSGLPVDMDLQEIDTAVTASKNAGKWDAPRDLHALREQINRGE